MKMFKKGKEEDYNKDFIVVFRSCYETPWYTGDEERMGNKKVYNTWTKFMDRHELIDYIKEHGNEDIYLVSTINKMNIEQIINIKEYCNGK